MTATKRGVIHTWLQVTVTSASNLVAKDRGGTSDPFYELQVPNEHGNYIHYKSKPIKKTLNPVWSSFVDKLEVGGINKVDLKAGKYTAPIIIDMWDWNMIGKPTFLGRASFPIPQELLKSNTFIGDYKLGARPAELQGKKKKDGEVGGTVKVSFYLEDFNISDEEIAQIQAKVKISEDKLSDMYNKFVRTKNGKDISTPQELVQYLRDSAVLEAVMKKWACGSNAQANTPKKDDSWELIKNDDEVMSLIATQYFDALDIDKSKTVSFEELVVGLNIILEGNNEQVLRMQYKARDKNGDGQLTKEEAKQLSKLTIALLRAGFILGIRTKAKELREAGLMESDFQPIIDAITGAFEKHDVAQIEADLLFKYADKNNDGFVTEDEYVEWALDENTVALRKAEVDKAMEPVLATMQADLTKAFTQLLQRIMRNSYSSYPSRTTRYRY